MMNRLLPIAALAVATFALPLARAGFYAEAGASLVVLQSADFTANPSYPHAVVQKDGSTQAPFVAVGYAVREWFGLRLSYQYLANLDSTVDRTFPGDPQAVVLRNHYSDDIHVLAFAPELTWKPAARLTLSIAPELQWQHLHEDVHVTPLNPAVDPVPHLERTENDWTLGGSVAATYAVSDRAAVALRYTYNRLVSSWHRRAHGVSVGFRWAL